MLIQKAIKEGIDNNRMSISGVSTTVVRDN